MEAVVEALAELLERDAAHMPRLFAELLEDDAAQERIAARLGCPTTQIPALLGGAAVALHREPGLKARSGTPCAKPLIASAQPALPLLPLTKPANSAFCGAARNLQAVAQSPFARAS